MKMLLAVGAPLLALFAPIALAQDGWYLVATSKDGNDSYSMKLGSGERSTNKGGESITVVVGKSADKGAGKISLMKWYVTDADCAQEYGNVVILELDGTFKFDAPFAKGSNSIASGIAETLCSVGASEARAAAAKGI